MPAEYHRLIDSHTLVADFEQPVEYAFDAGAYSNLEVQVRVLKAGTAGNVVLQHAAVNEPGSYMDLDTTSTSVSTAANTHKSVSSFLRYVRVKGDASVAGSPVVTVEVVAKS